MKKIFILLLFFPFFCLRVFSQTVEQPPENEASLSHDTALFNLYMKKAGHFSDVNNDSMYYYLHQANSLAQSFGYSKGLSQYYHFLAATYNEHSLYDSAMLAARKEMYWANQSKDSLRIAWAYNAIANVYEYIGDYDSSTYYFIRALHIINPAKYKKLSGTLNYNLASVLYLIGDYNRALGYAKKGYAMGEALEDTHMMSNSRLNMGCIQVGLKQFDTALKYFDEVISMVRHTPDSLTILDALNNKGDVYARTKQFDKSLASYKHMLQLAQQSGDSYYLLYAYGNLGITQFQMQKLQEAEKNLNKAILLSQKQNARNELRQFYESMSEVKEARKQFAAALAYRKKYDSLNDTLMSESTQKNMHLLEIKYQTAQKDKQIAQQKLVLTQNQRAIEQKTTWMFIFLGGLIALIAILVLSIRNYRHKRNLHQQNLQTLQKQHEVNTLKTKMEAREEERNRIGQEMHDDIGSALTTILYLSNDLKTQSNGNNKHTSERIAETAGNVVDKMNEIIWSMNQEYDTLDDLIAYTRQHAANFLKNYNMDYHFETPDPVPDIHLQGEQRRNIYLVIKESLHNIVKHACATKVEVSFLLNKNLTITIHDNGKGVDKENLRRFGNGLQNMKQRMEAVGGSFEIISNKGTCVKLECPAAVSSRQW